MKPVTLAAAAAPAAWTPACPLVQHRASLLQAQIACCPAVEPLLCLLALTRAPEEVVGRGLLLVVLLMMVLLVPLLMLLVLALTPSVLLLAVSLPEGPLLLAQLLVGCCLWAAQLPADHLLAGFLQLLPLLLHVLQAPLLLAAGCCLMPGSLQQHQQRYSRPLRCHCHCRQQQHQTPSQASASGPE